MTFDDQWVDEVGRGFAACSVFLWLPLYWLTYNQLNNNLTSQAAVMKLNGLPNDVLSNLDPFALIILIPVCDLFIYPALRKRGINFTPIKRIAAGFFTGSMAMIWAAVIQAYIYKKSSCGKHAASDGCDPVDINVWAQTGAYVLIAISESMYIPFRSCFSTGLDKMVELLDINHTKMVIDICPKALPTRQPLDFYSNCMLIHHSLRIHHLPRIRLLQSST